MEPGPPPRAQFRGMARARVGDTSHSEEEVIQMSAPLPKDKAAGFIGLVVSVVFLFGVLTAIVKMTNAKYAAATPAAETK